MKNTFVISCPIDTYSGYGSRSRDLVKALINLDKYDVKVIPQRWGNTPWNFIEDHNEEWGFLKPHLTTNKLSTQPDIWAQITVPNEFQAVGKFNIGITAGIETTICAPQWIEGMNKMNLNLVSSEHSKKVFQDSKFQKKDDKTGQIIDQRYCSMHFPYYWRYDLLRALEYFAMSDHVYDQRLDKALDWLLSKQKNNRFKLSAQYSGLTYFSMEKAGKESKINTVRALKVLKTFNRL
jgi:hypothetical protein